MAANQAPPSLGYIHMCVYIYCVHVCIHIYVYIHICVYRCVYTNIYMCVSTHIYIYVHIHMCVCIGVYVCIHIYTCVCVCTYICVCFSFFISFPVRSPQSTNQSSLSCIVGSYSSSILHIVVYICKAQSPNSSQPLFPLGSNLNVHQQRNG